MSLGNIFQPRIDPATQNDPNLASRTMTMDDYKNIHRRTTELGSLTGFGLAGLITYGVAKTIKPTRNLLFLTFFSSATLLSMASTHYLLSDSVNTIRLRQRAPTDDPAAGHVRMFDDKAAELAKAVEDPDLRSWKAGEGAAHGMEGGVAGMEDLVDRYATTRGDH
ncbi:hypothetical protein QFC20_003573 [Naganishia adeliensis]|uniref:Uncharacterized protein n=1 Tax=Naganishia adeliensis TaxID=92952 RepID=A0ACC2WAL0_9TREE|nr:hypothetical protein QFC20_003573 [Naganishia adeliensis]